MSEFMNFLSTKTWSRPEEGHHTLVIESHEIPKDSEYIKITGTLDDSRPYTTNLFEMDVRFAISAIREGHKELEGATPLDILKFAEKQKIKLDIWLSYPTVQTKTGLRQVTNIYWKEPVNTTEVTDTAEVEGL